MNHISNTMPAYAVLGIVQRPDGALLSAEVFTMESKLQYVREEIKKPGLEGYKFHEVPLSVAIGAGSLLTFVRRLSDGGHHAGEETALCAHAVLGSLGLLED